MKFEVQKKEHYTIFKLVEEKLDSRISPDVKSEFVQLNTNGVVNLIFDMSEVKYADSSGLSSILTANRLFSNDDRGMFVMCNITSHVEKLIKISQLDTVLTILPTLEESVEHIHMHVIEKELKDPSDN